MGHPHLVKKCPDCAQTKSVDDFYPSSKGTRGRDGYCIPCRRTRDRARQADRNQKVAAALARDPFHFRRKKLVTLYGITLEEYQAMFDAQDGKCAICSMPETRVMYGKPAHLVVDHNHATRKVRALLCHRCNTALAPVENEDFRLRALKYLEQHAHPDTSAIAKARGEA